MPLGKKIRNIHHHTYLDGKPRVVIFGHSMPKRLFRFFDQEMIPSDYLYHYGEKTRQQCYASYFSLNQLFGEIDFVHCPGIFSPLCTSRVKLVKEMNPDAVLVHISSNDLSGECISEEAVADCVFETFENMLKDSTVKLVIFVSELKRADEIFMGGRLKCSAADFAVRVKGYNEAIKEKCRKKQHVRFEWLPGMWWDVDKREIDVWEWSSDNLHPGTDTASEGFYRYFHALRQVFFKSYHQIVSQMIPRAIPLGGK